jgi:hypothetical protein
MLCLVSSECIISQLFFYVYSPFNLLVWMFWFFSDLLEIFCQNSSLCRFSFHILIFLPHPPPCLARTGEEETIHCRSHYFNVIMSRTETHWVFSVHYDQRSSIKSIALSENAMKKEYYQWKTTCRSVQQHILLSIRKEQQLKTYLMSSIQLCVLYSIEPHKQQCWSMKFVLFIFDTHIGILTVFHRQYGRWYWPLRISVRSCLNRLVSAYQYDAMNSMTTDTWLILACHVLNKILRCASWYWQWSIKHDQCFQVFLTYNLYVLKGNHMTYLHLKWFDYFIITKTL